MMGVRPMKRYHVPAYPTRLEVLADPGILADNVPHNWRENAVTAAALGVFLAANACTYADTGSKPVQPKAAVVAPIFEHGAGRGTVGCVAVSPPVFLSEEDALQVITEQLTAAGLEIAATDVGWRNVKIPQRQVNYRRVGDSVKQEFIAIPGTERPLVVDITDSKHGVAVEYVSRADYHLLGGPESLITVEDCDFKDVAAGVGKAVEKDGPGVYFGTFYDPMVPLDTDQFKDEKDARKRWEQMRAQGEAEAKRLLELQVKDFIDWLKGQGVI